MNDFEELAHRSADAARTSVDHLDVPEMSGRSGTSRVVLAGLGVGVLALLVGIALTWQDDDSSPAEIAGNGAGASSAGLVHLVWPDPPDGVELAAAVDFPVLVAGQPLDEPVAQTMLFGAGTEQDPFADGDLLVSTAVTGEDLESDFTGDPVVVRAKEGFRDSEVDLIGGGSAVSWLETESLAVVLLSRTLDTDRLLSIAEELTFDGHRAVVGNPEGLELLAETASLPFSRLSAADTGFLLSYITEPQDTLAVIQAATGGPEALLLTRYLAGSTEPVTVRGEPGWLLAGGNGVGFGYGENSVFWSIDGVLFSVSVSDDLDPVAIADELVEIDDDAWQGLVEESEARQREVGGERELITEGQFATASGAVEWRLALGDGGLCLGMESGRAGASGCIPLTTDAWSFHIDRAPGDGEEVLAVAGAIAESVDRVILEGAEVVELAIYELATEPGRVIGNVRPAPTDPVELVAFGADGTELWRRQLDNAAVPDDLYPAVGPPDRIDLMEGYGGGGFDVSLSLQGDILCLDATGESEGAGTCGAAEIVSAQLEEGLVIGGLVDNCVDSVALTNGQADFVDFAQSRSERGLAFWALVDPERAVKITVYDAGTGSLVGTGEISFSDADGALVGTGDVERGVADITC